MKRPHIGESEVSLSAEGVANSPAKLIDPGSVLVVVRSGILKHSLPVAVTTRPVTINQDMKALTPNDSLVSSYLARLLKYLEPTVLSWVRATTADNFPIDSLLDSQIELPSTAEQQRLAAILDAADTIRAKRRALLDHLSTLKAGLIGELMSQSVWGATLADLAQVQIGPFGSLLHQEDYIDGGVALLNPMHIRQGRLWPDPSYSVSEGKAESLSAYRVRVGDVVLGRRGEMGRAGIVRPEFEGLLCGTGSLILRPRDGITSEFLHAVVTSPRVKAHFERASIGATLANLNSTIVSTTPVPTASISLQRALAERVAAFDVERARVERALAIDDELFASLQSRAFSGGL